MCLLFFLFFIFFLFFCLFFFAFFIFGGFFLLCIFLARQLWQISHRPTAWCCPGMPAAFKRGLALMIWDAEAAQPCPELGVLAARQGEMPARATAWPEALCRPTGRWDGFSRHWGQRLLIKSHWTVPVFSSLLISTLPYPGITG